LKTKTTDSKSYADCYHKNRSDIDEQASVILELISDLIGNISKISVLDVGSGPGRLAIPIGQQVHKIVCIESDLSAVNYLQNRAERNNVKIKVYPAKIQDLSSEEIGCFDLVILSHIIHWIDVSLLLDLSKEYIIDDGYILLSYFDLDNLEDMLFYKISGEKILKIQKLHTLSTLQIENLLSQADFNIIHRIEIPIKVDYGNEKLESIINSAGTLAWKKSQESLSEREYSELKSSALTRLNSEPSLINTEYRTMILAQKKVCPNDLD
jgi:2-polyprenyl-3-methyl-5-hydroxy-6-metoxy-1,4-benzoquinol methylase